MTKRPEKKDRIELLDVLRGVAILGTLGSNVWLFSYVSSPENPLFNTEVRPWESLDEFLATTTLFFTNGKFLALLTVLFGVGLEIQYRSARRRGLPWPSRYLWRSALLFFEGFLHYVLVFEYDILMGYALSAIVVAFIVGRSDRFIRRAMWAAGGLHLALFGLASVALAALTLTAPEAASFSLYSPEAARVYASGSYVDQVLYRLDNLVLYRIEPLFIIPMNVFLYLLGVRLMRSGAFVPDEAGRRIRRKMLRYGLLLGVPLNALVFFPGGLFDLPVRYFFAPVLALGYVGIVALLLDGGALRWLADRLAEVGRLALSCYILQNVLASAVFYGWGLGLAGAFGAVGTLGVMGGIWAALALFSNLWLRCFSQGPFEWLMRSLAALPFRKRKPKAG
ncbi:putative membrane protein [Rubrobacter radiotolerans]|uniref:DUF418 domain-containing protein n=1 Tax=Rubrobacter radiotolerans TaxID=42256 RepID=A0A023X5A8_RUBRA|nr:DUF418 domain-containing protein [Rubrobacter radiotolerans]AHY47513.1 putative membrane protein [Rubrobacter radiotolerans]MDX5894916.1 DUF418 domain-containing protein [Rubrobacter radiotolerans]SMC07061.1 uncharacterized protein SAMN00767673_2232 [Rubrobacter radiotolerans DSM 5868]